MKAYNCDQNIYISTLMTHKGVDIPLTKSSNEPRITRYIAGVPDIAGAPDIAVIFKAQKYDKFTNVQNTVSRLS